MLGPAPQEGGVDTMWVAISGALFLLAFVIFAHELFHFLVAKALRVKVLKFSIGFGPALWKRQKGETEYQVAALPLGGYVKMQGESAQEKDEDPRSYLNRPAAQRALIVLAGPIGNLALPVLAMTLLYLVGVNELSTQIRHVEHQTLAEARGFRPGDRVRHVDGEPVETWSEVERRIPQDGSVTLVVERDGLRRGIPIPAAEFKHLSPYPYEPVLGVVAGTPAAASGLKSGDRVKRVGDVEVRTWEQLKDALHTSAYPLRLELERDGEKAELTLEAVGSLAGIELPDLYVSNVMPDSPAERAGVRPYDKIVSIAGAPMGRWGQLVETIQAHEGKAVELTVIRGAERLIVPVEVASVKVETATGDTQTVGRIGIQPLVALAEAETIMVRSGPLAALQKGFRRTGEVAVLHLKVLANLVQGKVSAKNIGGPILIIKAASSSAREGLQPYLVMLSFISVGLAIINLFPIPLLDGGQLLLLAVEAVRRRPLSLRSLEVAQHAGLLVLVSMMVFAFYNDIMRDRDSLAAFFRKFLDLFGS